MSPKKIALSSIVAVAAGCLVACGGGGQAGIGGTLSGLDAGQSVTLQDNNADTLTVTANGTFRFASELNAGSAYNVTILTQPVAQICQVANGTGSVDSGANSVGSVAIACVPTSSLGGTVSGLAPGTAVTLSNGSVLLPVATDGPFAFPGVLVNGTNYQVSVATEPAGQTCALTNGTGVTSATSQNAVTVTCS